KSVWQTVNEKPMAYQFYDASGRLVRTVKIADVNPDFNMSFTTNLRYKNFSAYALVDWVQGGKIYNGTRQWPFFELRDRVYDQSNKPAAPAGTPYSTGKKSIDYYNFFYNSINPIDFFVENGTYVKIKELNVSYSFGRSTLGKLGIGLNNPRAPDSPRLLSDPATVQSIAVGALRTWYNTTQAMDPDGSLIVMARSHVASWNNWQIRIYTGCTTGPAPTYGTCGTTIGTYPRIEWQNDPTAAARVQIEGYWYGY